MKPTVQTIGWRNHIWALSAIAALLSGLLLANFKQANACSMSVLAKMSGALNFVLAAISILLAVVIYVRHSVLKKNKDSLEKILMVLAFVLFAFVAFDRIVLEVINSIQLAASAETQKGLSFFATMVYLARKNQKTFVRGIINTVELALIGTLVGFILALVLVFARIQKPNKRDSEGMQAFKLLCNSLSSLYITVIRGTPMMVQSLIIYYSGFNIVKAMFPNYTISQLNGIYSVFLASAVTVSLNTTAYITEILRGSVEAIDKGQTEASRSLGMSAWQTMMNVVFPQAVKNSIPAICNEFIINVKDTSVLNVIGMTELMFMTTTVAGTYYKYLETYMITAVIYLLLTICLQAFMNMIAKKLDMPVQHGVPSSN